MISRCSVPGCDAPMLARGWCRSHYERARRNHGDPTPAVPRIDHRAFARPAAQAWYWMGFLAADGCVTDRAAIQLRLAGRDRGHLEALREFVGAGRMGSDSGRISGPHRDGSSCLTFVSQLIAADLWRHARIAPRKTLVYTPGPRAATQPAFWLGMLDGDGTVYWHRDRRWSAPARPELIWTGTREAMTAAAAFWQEHLDGHRVGPPRPVTKGALWELRLAAQASAVAAPVLLDACDYSLARKRTALHKVAAHRPAHVAVCRPCAWCGTQVRRSASRASGPRSFCSQEHNLLWRRAGKRHRAGVA